MKPADTSAPRDDAHPRRAAIEQLGQLVAELTRAGDFVGAQEAARALTRLVGEDAARPPQGARGDVIDLASRRRT